MTLPQAPASTAPAAAPGSARWGGAGRLLGWLAVALPPVLLGLWVASTSFGGTFWPWHPVMVDLGVYREAGGAALVGADFYHLPSRLPFLYPPIAALLAVPLALLPAGLVEVGWTVASVVALLALLRRFGLRGWLLCLVTCGAIWAVEPVRQTLAFGQVGIVLVALVVVDLLPTSRSQTGMRSGRLTGAMTGLAAAIKLTPGLFAVYLFAAGRRRPAVVTVVSFVVVTAAAGLVLRRASLTFWGRLATGDTGLGHSVIYADNQSVTGSWLRVFGIGHLASVTALGASALVAALGVVVAVRWHRLGQVRLAVCLGGLATLLASPVSWSHHFVWILPLAISLATTRLPRSIRVLGLVLVVWVAVAPYQSLPNGADVELTYTWTQNLFDSVTLLLGVALLAVAAALPIRAPAPVRSGRAADG